MKVTVCFTYFRSLALANLAAALYSVRRQDLSLVERVVVVDNNTDDSSGSIQSVIDNLEFPVPVNLYCYKHGDSTRTHAWSTNVAVREASDWIFFTRADYILDFDIVQAFVQIAQERPQEWNGFITANVYHLGVDIGVCETTHWRSQGTHTLRSLPGVENDYMSIDSGVWMARRSTFDKVGGLDESLSAWGHAQTHFQHKLYESGVEFVHIAMPMFYHPQHAAQRDLGLAHSQLKSRGADLRAMWKRYKGVNPYR